MFMSFMGTVMTNLFSSIVYEIGKEFIKNRCMPISEEQMSNIFKKFQDELNEIFHSQSEYFKKQNEQNEIILKLLLAIYDTRSDITIRNINDEYIIYGDCSLDCLKNKAMERAQKYESLVLKSHPLSLGDAIWPIPNEIKKELLNEIENNLYKT